MRAAFANRSVSTNASNQAMQLTASKTAIDVLRVCPPRLWFHGSSPRACRSLSPSR